MNKLSENIRLIHDDGFYGWTSPNSIVLTYFKTRARGKINVGLNMKVANGISTIKVSLNGVSKEVEVSNTEFEDIQVGVFNIDDIGYNYIEIQGITKTRADFGEITQVLLGGSVAESKITYVPDDFY